MEFFPPDLVHHTLHTQKIAKNLNTTADFSGRTPEVMAIRAKLQACENDDQRVALLQQLEDAEARELTYYSSE